MTQSHVTKFHRLVLVGGSEYETIAHPDGRMRLHNKLTPTWMLLSDDTKTLYRDFSSLIPTLFLPRAEEEMSLGMRQELECYFLFADTMAPISPDSATGDGPSFISLLDPRTGKVFLQ